MTKRELAGNHGWDEIVAKGNEQLAKERTAQRERDKNEARERWEKVARKMGWLPPLQDRKGVAAGEIAELENDVKFYEEKIRARMGVAAPKADLDDDAYWESDWAIYSAEELLSNLIGAARRLGGLTSNSQTRQTLERSAAKAEIGAKGAAKRAESALKRWAQILPIAAAICDEHRGSKKSLTQEGLRDAILIRCAEQGVECPPEGLLKKLREWEKSQEIQR